METIRVRYRNGVIEPLKKIDLPDTEVTITITEAKPEEAADALERSAGAWKDKIDCDALIGNIYADRLAAGR